MEYESTLDVESRTHPGVRFFVRRMSFGKRLELTRIVKDTLARLEYVEAGAGGVRDEAEAALLGAEVDKEYLRWGLVQVEGLYIDGAPATPDSLIEAGPEGLAIEALEAVRREAGLSEEERKNSESPSTSPTPTKPGGSATNAGESAWSASGVAAG